MLSRVPVILSLFAAIAFSAQSVAQEHLLRWKFQKGERINYNVQQNMNTVMKVGDNEINQSMKQSMEMAWEILDVAAGGDVIMNQIVGRIQMTMAGGPAGDINFDTSNPAKSENAFVNAMGQVFRKIVNQNFRVNMTPTGEVGDVTIPEQLLEAIQTSAAGNASALNEDTLKQMMKQSAVTLPTQKVSQNDKWTSQQVVQLPFGTMTIKSTMTLLEIDGNGIAAINIVPDIQVTPKEGAPVKMTLTSSSGQGKVMFNIATGRVSKSTLDLRMEMKIDSGQQVFNQTINQSTSLTLVP